MADCEGEEQLFNTKYACPDCNISFLEVEPRLFSFNSPFGACPECTGLGYKQEIDPELIYGDGSKTLREGALTITGWNFDNAQHTLMYFEALARKYGFSLDVPFRDLPEEIKHILLYGNNGEKMEMTYNSYNFSGSFSSSFEGIVTNLERRYRETSSDWVKSDIERFMRQAAVSRLQGPAAQKRGAVGARGRAQHRRNDRHVGGETHRIFSGAAA